MKKIKTITVNGVSYAFNAAEAEEVEDIRTGYDGSAYENAGEAVRAQVGAIEKRYEKPKNLINPDRIVYGKYYDGSGNLKSNSTFAVSEFISVIPNENYNFSYPQTEDFSAPYASRAVFFNADKVFISAIETITSGKAIVAPAEAAYIRLNFYVSHLESIGCPMLFVGKREVTAYARHEYEFESVAPISGEKLKDRTVKRTALAEDVITNGKNLFDKSKVTPGYLTKFSEKLTANDTLVTSDFIPVKAGTAYTISPYGRMYSLFNTEKDLLLFDDGTNINIYTPYTITPEDDGFLRVTVQSNILDTVQIEVGSEATAFEPFVYELAENITLSKKQKESIGAGAGNVLYGKKWVACGDSYTRGSTAGTFTEGKFIGEYKSYPFLIGERNDMEIVNLAHDGQSLASPNPHGYVFSDSDPEYEWGYQKIPADADYITIKLGINDHALQLPIGTIDDADNTTFYGAWNVVLEHIIVNHPLAKIGIIVTNATTMGYVDATIAVAEKWGIPYLNEATGVLVPTMHRTNKDLPESVANARRDAFTNYLQNGDTHPNAAGHAYESTFVENFLRSL